VKQEFLLKSVLSNLFNLSVKFQLKCVSQLFISQAAGQKESEGGKEDRSSIKN
jgi:hypothetical protein